MVSSFVPGFQPSTHGLHFENDFAQAPVVTVTFPLLGERGFGDASGGLCGGMIFAVCDLFQAGLAPPAGREPPLPGTPLFEYLCQRLLDSFHLPAGVLKYYDWMRRPDADGFFGRGPASRTVSDEWPAVKEQIDSERLAPLGLVTVHSLDPADLGQCHQVLAYGYDVEGDGSLRVHVYDPNWPDRDDLTIALNLNAPGPITYSAGLTVRGFFLTTYAFADPVAALPPG